MTSCKKKAFKDLREAHKALERIKKRNDRPQVPQRVYACEECGKYHLTKHTKEKYREYFSDGEDKIQLVRERLSQLLSKTKLSIS